jgi:Icc protein
LAGRTGDDRFRVEAQGMGQDNRTAMRPVQLLHLTDAHLFGDPAGDLYGVRTAESFNAVLQHALDAPGRRPDAVLVTGDIAEDESAAAYVNFRRAVRVAAAPVYCIPGNHDSPELMAASLDADGIRFCGAHELGAWRLVLLSSHLPRDPAGRVSAAGLQQFEAELRERALAPTLVAVHHPPALVGSRWLDGVGLRNADELLEIVARYPHVRVIVSGHVHQQLDVRRGSLRILATPSTCAQFTPHTERCVMDQRPPGYRWLTLSADGSIDTEVVWLQGWTNAGPVTDTRA